ncbi:MAG: hypothetical protein HYX72_14020 [Acidobacteria bacterium]|nr:hypothetical protein [Acidobacteriota bacterium]
MKVGAKQTIQNVTRKERVIRQRVRKKDLFHQKLLKKRVALLADLQLAVLGLMHSWDALWRIERCLGEELDFATEALEELLSSRNFHKGVAVTVRDLKTFLRRADASTRDKSQPFG